MWITYSMAWIATALATSIGIYYTKDANCLWAMLIPGMISMKSNSGKKDKEETDEIKELTQK